MEIQYDYSKFNEWLLLKKYSPASAATTVRATQYFSNWAAGEGITELEAIRYPDAMVFIAWSSRQGASQKTIANYLTHISKYYQFLISEGAVKENPVAHIKIQGIKRKVYHDILNVEELQLLHHHYPTNITIAPAIKNPPPQERNIMSRKRNKVILGLVVYQGLRAEELAALELHDLQLREGKITIHSQRRTAGRTMKLESHQVYELMDYIHEIRKQFLTTNTGSSKLFLQWKAADNFHSITQMILKHLRQINPRVKNLDQLRASVITAWLKQYDLRKVQYLSGHKYVSSTEAYKANNIDELQSDVTKYHPL
jgi:site-specific recombinase XerD